MTSVGPDGVTRHVLPDPGADHAEWVFTAPSNGRDLALEVPDADRSAVVGDPHDRDSLRWSRPASVRVPAVLGETELATWPEELYTAELVGGPDTAPYAAARRAAVARRTGAEMGVIDALTDPAPGSFADLHTIHTEPGQDPTEH